MSKLAFRTLDGNTYAAWTAEHIQVLWMVSCIVQKINKLKMIDGVGQDRYTKKKLNRLVKPNMRTEMAHAASVVRGE